jgi:hypothetical protein
VPGLEDVFDGVDQWRLAERSPWLDWHEVETKLASYLTDDDNEHIKQMLKTAVKAKLEASVTRT